MCTGGCVLHLAGWFRGCFFGAHKTPPRRTPGRHRGTPGRSGVPAHGPGAHTRFGVLPLGLRRPHPVWGTRARSGVPKPPSGYPRTAMGTPNRPWVLPRAPGSHRPAIRTPHQPWVPIPGQGHPYPVWSTHTRSGGNWAAFWCSMGTIVLKITKETTQRIASHREAPQHIQAGSGPEIVVPLGSLGMNLPGWC